MKEEIKIRIENLVNSELLPNENKILALLNFCDDEIKKAREDEREEIRKCINAILSKVKEGE